MPRFNFASQTAAAQTAANPVTNAQTEPQAPVQNTPQAAPTPAPQPAPQVATPTQAQKAIAKITELQTTGALVVHTYMDEERDEARIKFTSSETDAEGLKKAAHWLSALNAEWNFEGTGKERTATFATLPSAVFTDPDAAESAHEAARAKWDARKQRNEQYKAQKAQTPATVSNGSVAGSSRTFTETEVRALLKKANATLTAELIDLLIKTA